jgi:hypothetical protein
MRKEFEKLPEIAEIIKEGVFWDGEIYRRTAICKLTHLYYVRGAWYAWQAKAQAVQEGFVLVPKEKISYFWQDNDEPENFCSNESDFDCLGDCIDLGEIIEINKFTQAHVNKEKLFGTWFAEAIDPSEKANFFVGTHAECLEIVAKNKAVIEAQEQSK